MERTYVIVESSEISSKIYLFFIDNIVVGQGENEIQMINGCDDIIQDCI